MTEPSAIIILKTVAIGSKNPAKTEGVRNVFGKFVPEAKFVEVEAGSVTKTQPFGFAETLRGAKNRAKFALKRADADLGVGVEAGVLTKSQCHLNLQVAAIIDKGGVFSIGSSAGFMLPGRFVERMRRESEELDHYTHELTGEPKVRAVDGIIYHLSKGMLSRLQMTEQCVAMALVPWLNREAYGFDVQRFPDPRRNASPTFSDS